MKKITFLFAFLLTISFANAQTTYTEDFSSIGDGWYNGNDNPAEQNLNHNLAWTLMDVRREGSSRTNGSGPGLRGRVEMKSGSLVTPFVQIDALRGGMTEISFEAGTFWTPKPVTATAGFKVYVDDVLDNQSATQPRNPSDTKWKVTLAISGASDASKTYKVRIEWWCPECTADGNLANLGIGAISWKSVNNSLSVKDNALSDALSVYPNPSSKLLNVKLNNNISVKRVQLLDLTGKSIYSQVNDKAINVSKFAKGLYLLKVESNDGATASRKVVIQ